MVCDADQSGGDELDPARRPAEPRKLGDAGGRAENGDAPGFELSAASDRATTRRLGGARKQAAGRAESRMERCTRKLAHGERRALWSSLH